MSRRRAVLKGVLTAVVLSLVFAASAGAATITVNTADDDGTATGDCELRDAIDAANGDSAEDGCEAGLGDDLIQFNIAGAGVHTIQPLSRLPTISGAGAVEIDGKNGTAGPRIEIDATNTAVGEAGLITSTGAEGSYFHDFAIYNANDDGIRLLVDDNTVERVAAGVTIGGVAAGNGDQGIYIRANGATVRDSVISGNAQSGIQVDSSLAALDDTTIAGNVIGSDVAGTAALGNGADGIRVFGGFVPTDLTIGGTTGLTPGGACTGDCNQISDNTGDGIELALQTNSSPLVNPAIRGNFIGTDSGGTGDLGNTQAGIRLSGNIDGAVVRDNLISGNGGDGIDLLPGTVGGPSHTTIAANRIGVDTQGDNPVPNTGRGIVVSATVDANDGPMIGNVIGGTTDPTPGGVCDGDCNVIGGNTLDGVELFRVSISAPVTGTQVIGNHIGVDQAGTGDLGNGQWGVVISGGSAGQIGSAAAPNVISGNGASGVLIGQNTEGGNKLEGNRIGTTADGSGALGNDDSGVEASSGGSGVSVGGIAAGAGNTIANNGLDGVSVAALSTPTAAVPILGNSIRDNTDLGIDLSAAALDTGVTANDGAGDADTGGNGLQNFPVLDTVAVVGASTYVMGTLDSVASTTFRIEVFANTVPDGSGNGEGAELAGSFDVTTDATGHAAFTRSFAGSVAAGKSTTATATRLDGSGNPLETSEFAANLAEGCDVNGTAGPDALNGTAAAEVICGQAGDDTITGGGGDDVIAGGDGTDTTSYTGASSAVTVNLPAATATGGGGSDLLDGVEGASGSSFGDQLTALAAGSTLSGQGGSDTLNGGAGPDALDGGDGNDTLNGAASADALTGAGGADTGSGGDGNDTMTGGGGTDSLDGGNNNDTITGDDDTDALTGGAGADTTNGGGGADTGSGGDGNDTLNGGGANDSLDGGDGNDTANGDADDDLLTGAAGTDGLHGGDGNDTLSGGDGNDTVDGGTGANALDGGTGNDALTGGEGADTGTGGDGDDTITGNDGADAIGGGTGNDTVDGGLGDDDLAGEDGDDTVTGGDGDDTLTGDLGNDTVDGGAGNDDGKGNDGDDTVLGQSGDDTVLGGDGDDTVQSHGGRDDAEGGTGEDTVKAGGGDKDEARGQGGKDTVKGGGGDKDDVRGGGGKDKLDGGGGKKDKCDGGGGKDLKRAPGCESEKSIP
jgi:Ca2+-binding RTX toxin-like protein